MAQHLLLRVLYNIYRSPIRALSQSLGIANELAKCAVFTKYRYFHFFFEVFHSVILCCITTFYSRWYLSHHLDITWWPCILISSANPCYACPCDLLYSKIRLLPISLCLCCAFLVLISQERAPACNIVSIPLENNCIIKV